MQPDMPMALGFCAHGNPNKTDSSLKNTYQNVSRVDRSSCLQSTLSFSLVVGCVFAFGFTSGLVVLGGHDTKVL